MHFKMNIHWLQGREEEEKSVDWCHLPAGKFFPLVRQLDWVSSIRSNFISCICLGHFYNRELQNKSQKPKHAQIATENLFPFFSLFVGLHYAVHIKKTHKTLLYSLVSYQQNMYMQISWA